MSTAWLYLIPALFVQEAVTLGAALSQGLRAGTNPVLINLAWATITGIDIIAGYWLGRAAQRRFSHWRIAKTAGRAAAKVNKRIGERGLRMVLFALGFIMYPYVNSFVFSWLDVPFPEIFTFIFLGNALYWVFVWGAVMGISFLSGDSLLAVYIAVIAFAAFSLWRSFLAHTRAKRRGDASE